MSKIKKNKRNFRPSKRSPDEKKLLFLEFLAKNSGWHTKNEIVKNISKSKLGNNNPSEPSWLASIVQLKEKNLIKSDVQKLGGSIEYTVFAITDNGLELLQTIRKWDEEDHFFMTFNLFHLLD